MVFIVREQRQGFSERRRRPKAKKRTIVVGEGELCTACKIRVWPNWKCTKREEGKSFLETKRVICKNGTAL